MKHIIICGWIAALLSISSAAGNAWAAESDAASKTSPVPIIAPDTPDDQVALRLSPLTREDLAQEAKAWLGLLKAKTQQVVDVKLALQTAKGAEAERLNEALLPLTTQRRAWSSRLSDILDEWQLKGGDPKEIEPYRQYIKAVYAEQIKASRLTTTWTQFAEWLFSEEGGFAFFVKVIVVAIAFAVLWAVAKIVSALTGKAMKRVPNISILLKNFVTVVVFWITISIGLLIVLSVFGVNISGLLALVGGASFIIAFALQSTLSNFAAGLMIMIYKPFDVGNYVTVAGVAGTVKAVSLVSTTVTTPDNQVIVIPNSNIWGSVITNVTGSDTRRVDLVFGIGYQDDAQAAQRIMEEVVAQHELVLKEPAPVIRLHELGESSVNFVCRPWTKTSDYWAVYWDVTRRVKERFDAEGISIPFPQRDVHLYTVESGKPA
jgi:small conductance mechanosensitive channel